MELDDFFRNRQQNRRFTYDQNYRNNPFRSYHHGHNPNYKWAFLLQILKSNRKLKKVLIIAVIVMLAIVIALLAVLLPLIWRIIESISQHGIQGIVENVTAFLERIWKGSGN